MSPCCVNDRSHCINVTVFNKNQGFIKLVLLEVSVPIWFTSYFKEPAIRKHFFLNKYVKTTEFFRNMLGAF